MMKVAVKILFMIRRSALGSLQVFPALQIKSKLFQENSKGPHRHVTNLTINIVVNEYVLWFNLFLFSRDSPDPHHR